MRPQLWIRVGIVALALAAMGGFTAVLLVTGSNDSQEPSAAPPVAEEAEEEPSFLERPFLGVVLGEEVEGGGVRVREVLPVGPAQEAGLRAGDVILAVGDEPVANAEDVLEAIEDKEPGDSVTIVFRRQAEQHEAEVALGERPLDAAQSRLEQLIGGPRLGVVVRDITPDVREDLGLAAEEGVVVVEVAPGSAAARADIRRGDVIRSLDGEPVETAEALVDAIQEREPGDEVALEIQRDSRTLTVEATLRPGRGLGLPLHDAAPPARDFLEDLGLPERLRDLLPGLDLDLQGLGPERLLRRFVEADVTLLTDDGERTTLHLTAGTVREATSERLVLAPHGDGPEIEFDIDEETRAIRGLRRIEPGDIETGETAVVLTRDDETRARVVFVLPAP